MWHECMIGERLFEFVLSDILLVVGICQLPLSLVRDAFSLCISSGFQPGVWAPCLLVSIYVAVLSFDTNCPHRFLPVLIVQ